MAFFSAKKAKDTVAQKSIAKGVKMSKEVKSSEKIKDAKVVEAKTAPVKAVVVGAGNAGNADFSHDLASMIVRPRVTEKATESTSKGVYVFEVSKNSTKTKIAKAISVMYKVTPAKVRVVTLPAKNVFVRGKRGVKSGVKKAYVYLKKGDKIEII